MKKLNMSQANTPEPKSKSIKVLDQETIQKICFDQSFIDLTFAIKELVENSLDAGATLIEVKLIEFGLESIEVSDNGWGVKEDDLEEIAYRYSTSKIRNFSDLKNVETFGYRGEALYLLSTYTDIMTIETRQNSTDIGTRLEFYENGIISKKDSCTREVGTTITLKNIFKNYPVIRKFLSDKIKYEFWTMCQILRQYCLLSKNVKFFCTNQTHGSKFIICSTNGSNDIHNIIQSIYKNLNKENVIELKSPSYENDGYITLTQDDNKKLKDMMFNIEGFISSIAGDFRDRQYFYVNSRPCVPKNIVSLVNEVYGLFNKGYPFVCMNIFIKKSEVNFNLSINKRRVFINNETLLLSAIKEVLLRAFKIYTNIYLDDLHQPISLVDREECNKIKSKKLGLKYKLSRNNFTNNVQFFKSFENNNEEQEMINCLLEIQSEENEQK